MLFDNFLKKITISYSIFNSLKIQRECVIGDEEFQYK